MEKSEFLRFLEEKLTSYGFVKKKRSYYKAGDEVLCCVDFQASSYGKIYYINYHFFIGSYDAAQDFPSYRESDIDGRIRIKTKSQLYHGKPFMSALIHYEEYSGKELETYIDEALKQTIIPAIDQGKKFILEHKNIRFVFTEAVEKKLNGS